MQIQKSYMAKKDLKKKWYWMDAENQILGKIASQVAVILMGKHRPEYTPFIDTGDFVIITNAKKIKVTGRKYEDKMYYSWSGYPGGLKKKNFAEMISKHPEQVLKMAIRRMLPKNKLGRQMLKKLKIYADESHPHAAQSPQVWKA